MTNKHRGALHAAVLLVVSVALTYPLLAHGLTPGDDRRVHLEYQHFFSEQIDGGDFYPRWMPGLNLGRGSPIFFVQYPLPYYVAWGLGHLIPNHWGAFTETRSLGLSMVLATVLGAFSTYAWCTTFADSLSSMLAALLFLTLPYFFSIDLYSRNAIGEVWALVLMPLVFYFMERRPIMPRRSLGGLALVFGLILLSHLFTAALIVPVIFAYALWRSEAGKRFSALLQCVSAVALGTAVAAIYVLPLLANRHFLHPENVLMLRGPYYSPLTQMFLYDRSTFPRDTRGWHYLNSAARILAAATICLAGYSWFRTRREGSAPIRILLAGLSIITLGLTIAVGHLPHIGAIPGVITLNQDSSDQRAHIFLATFLTLLVSLICYWFPKKRINSGLADFLISLALVSFLMTTRWSLMIWNTVHPLWNIQFPWRFNIFIVLSAVGLAALALPTLGKRPLRERVLVSAVAIIIWGLVAGGIAYAGSVKVAFSGTQPVTYTRYRDDSLSVYAHVTKWQDALDAVFSPRNANPDVFITAGSGTANVNMTHPRVIELHAACETDCTLRIGQFYYPAWEAKFRQNGSAIPLSAAPPSGLMEVDLPAGNSDVVIELPRRWPERISPWVSLLSLILIVVLALSDKPRGATEQPVPVP